MIGQYLNLYSLKSLSVKWLIR